MIRSFYTAGEARARGTRRRVFLRGAMELGDRTVDLIAEDLEGIAARFEQMYEECVANVKKVAMSSGSINSRSTHSRSRTSSLRVSQVLGVRSARPEAPSGSGKSSLINSMFGGRFANVSDAVPLTQHYALFSPPDKPVAVYDSKVCTVSAANQCSNDALGA